uniref:Uncharacterized protein n=1 Tax=Sphaerodactylus townsendi TaxID=933632 RepID=A0ACB8FBZ1_9SAUR
MGLYKGRAPELHSFPRFMLAPRRQFEDLFEEEKARARLRQIQQGSRSVSEYIFEFRQLAWVVQDWPKQVKIHFFREGLHPELAQWAMSAATETAGQPLAGFSPSPVGGTSPARGGKEAGESLYGRWRRLGLCLSCSGEGHKAAVCPSKKPDPLVVPASSAVKVGVAKGPEKKFPFKKGSGLQVEPHEASLASEEAGGPKSSEELAGNNSDLA